MRLWVRLSLLILASSLLAPESVGQSLRALSGQPRAEKEKDAVAVAVEALSVDEVFCPWKVKSLCGSWFPTKVANKRGGSKAYFQQDEPVFAGAFRYRGLVGSSDTQSITAEIVSDTMGWLRIAVGTTLAKVDDESGTMTPEEVDRVESIEQFFASGGSLYADTELPMLNLGKPGGGAFQMRFSLAPRLGMNIPELGSSTEEVNWNIDTAAELQLLLSSDEGKIELYAGARYGYVAGSTEFYADLGVPNSGFEFGQWSAGLILNQLVVISMDGDISVPSALDDSFETRVSVSFLRKN